MIQNKNFRIIFSSTGFSLPEILVSLGIASVIAVGTGSLIDQSFKSLSDQQTRAEAVNIAKYIRNEILGRTNQKSQFLAIGEVVSAANAAAARNCGGRLNLVNSNHDTMLEQAQTQEGTKLRSNLPIGVIQNNANITQAGKVLRVRSYVLANADIVGQDAKKSVINGELYIEIGKPGLLSRYRRQFISRVVLDVSRVAVGGVNVNDLITCNSQVQYSPEEDNCLGDSYVFDPNSGQCVLEVTQVGTNVQLCPVGQVGASDGTANAVCNPIRGSCDNDRLPIRLSGGVLVCSNNRPLTAMAPPPTPVDATISPAPPASPIPPVATTLPPATLPEPPGGDPITPVPVASTSFASCQCGGNRIAHNNYCSYCYEEIDLGYGRTYSNGVGVETVYRVDQCQDGILRRMPYASIFSIPNASSCNGTWRPAIDTGSEYYRY